MDVSTTAIRLPVRAIELSFAGDLLDPTLEARTFHELGERDANRFRIVCGADRPARSGDELRIDPETSCSRDG
jgi:hypothetical protein